MCRGAVLQGCQVPAPGAAAQEVTGTERCQGETPVCKWAAGPYSLLWQQGSCSRHRPLLLELVDPFVLAETVKLRRLFSVGM